MYDDGRTSQGVLIKRSGFGGRINRRYDERFLGDGG